MKRSVIAATVVAIVLFVVVSSVRVISTLGADDQTAVALGVSVPVDTKYGSPLRNVEVYPGFVQVDCGDGNPENWTTRWYRYSDVEFERSGYSLVRFENGKVLIEHQQPLSRHGSMALTGNVFVAGFSSMILVPLLWGLFIGTVTLLCLTTCKAEMYYRADHPRQLRFCKHAFPKR